MPQGLILMLIAVLGIKTIVINSKDVILGILN